MTAIEYVHSKGWVHRDLKPENFLLAVENDEMIKVSDFGLAKKVEDPRRLDAGAEESFKESYTKYLGTYLYKAPEVCDVTKAVFFFELFKLKYHCFLLFTTCLFVSRFVLMLAWWYGGFRIKFKLCKH